jgi:nitroreductase
MSDRAADSPLVNDLFVERWSPRAFSDEPVTDEQLAAIFEAARWAPSWMNNQPWYFIYATDGPDRDAILNVFMEFNRGWASKAPVVGLVLARTALEGFMARTRDFDTGAATMSMAHQASLLGLSMHLIGGVEVEAAHALTGTDPATTEILAGFMIGHRGDPASLPETLQSKETPSSRKPVSAFAIRGTKFPS